MTTYEKIKSLLELGTLKGVEVKGVKSGDIYLCVHLTERGEIVVLAEDRGIVRWCSPAVFNLEFDEPITPIPQKPKVLRVGTKVRVLEIARECGYSKDTNSEFNTMIGKTLEITENDDDNTGVSYQLSDDYWLPAYCVVPVFEEEEKEEPTIEKWARETVIVKDEATGKKYQLTLVLE